MSLASVKVSTQDFLDAATEIFKSISGIAAYGEITMYWCSGCDHDQNHNEYLLTEIVQKAVTVSGVSIELSLKTSLKGWNSELDEIEEKVFNEISKNIGIENRIFEIRASSISGLPDKSGDDHVCGFPSDDKIYLTMW